LKCWVATLKSATIIGCQIVYTRGVQKNRKTGKKITEKTEP
jgi:hypothetical protein